MLICLQRMLAVTCIINTARNWSGQRMNLTVEIFDSGRMLEDYFESQICVYLFVFVLQLF